MRSASNSGNRIYCVFLCFIISQHGTTALMFAALVGHTECVRLLLNAGADRRAHDNVRVNMTATV